MLPGAALVLIFTDSVVWAVGGSSNRLPAGAAAALIAAHGVEAVGGVVAWLFPRGAFIHISTCVLTLIPEDRWPRNRLIAWAASAVVAPFRVLAVC